MTEIGQNDRLTRNQLAGLEALAVTSSTREAAARVGVSERTLRRWMGQAAFMAAYRAQTREVSAHALQSLMAAQQEAVQVLRDGLAADSIPTRIRAASRLLEIGLKVREHDIEERLEELERRAASWQQSNELVRRG
ncbi:hypothetical protein AB4Y77_03600 [Paenarthrobacter sp. YAF11_1]|uniref:hypothetical protein n=1 Tax=Paenarthrobacter sp. YAF11_1 TaxID=3233074 RepID=UPI003F9BC8CA